ncbi:methyltransferase family protein [Variovorax sp. RT4R15]|uniref:methyltransferase family protein n=1 Tax=Variovorax sp. RT4R15 TaxID=3443737 RepID=UPI003F46DF15
MASLEHKIPPPVVALLVLPVMWLLSTALPRIEVSSQLRVAVAVCIALAGLGFSSAGALAFKRAKTTVNPLRPERATALVTSGVYRITRNPMYVGLLLGLLAWAVLLSSPLSLAGPVAFITYINRFQIDAEERVLVAKFGADYASYRSRVRRWL